MPKMPRLIRLRQLTSEIYVFSTNSIQFTLKISFVRLYHLICSFWVQRTKRYPNDSSVLNIFTTKQRDGLWAIRHLRVVFRWMTRLRSLLWVTKLFTTMRTGRMNRKSLWKDTILHWRSLHHNSWRRRQWLTIVNFFFVWERGVYVTHLWHGIEALKLIINELVTRIQNDSQHWHDRRDTKHEMNE